MSGKTKQSLSFNDLILTNELLDTLESLGYEAPSPVQAQAIPHLLNGDAILGHANGHR